MAVRREAVCETVGGAIVPNAHPGDEGTSHSGKRPVYAGDSASLADFPSS